MLVAGAIQICQIRTKVASQLVTHACMRNILFTRCSYKYLAHIDERVIKTAFIIVTQTLLYYTLENLNYSIIQPATVDLCSIAVYTHMHNIQLRILSVRNKTFHVVKRTQNFLYFLHNEACRPWVNELITNSYTVPQIAVNVLFSSYLNSKKMSNGIVVSIQK